jgi:nicotinate-nucleotide pyrophosphorylase (carboxylating)
MLSDLNALSLPQLFNVLTENGSLRTLLEIAKAEDLRDVGDVTSEAVIEPSRTGHAVMVLRQPGILAGLEAMNAIIDVFAPAVSIEHSESDGDDCPAGRTIARLHGPLRDLLTAERTMLNIVGHLSGIATLTGRYVDAVLGTTAVICETRKTLPGLRNLEKYAVRCGGGTLHRRGLWDAILLKDNHLAHIPLADWIAVLGPAIAQAKATRELRFVQIEVDTLEQLEVVLQLDSDYVDMVLLDNMPPDTLRQAVHLKQQHHPGLILEASGGVTLDTVRGIAETGVERISIGAITHSAPALDIGLDITGG